MAAASERETVICFNDEDDIATVYTANKRVADMLTGKGLEPVKVDTYRGQPTGWTFAVPKWAIRIKPGKFAIYVGGRKGQKSGRADIATATAGETGSV